jgi:phosphoglycolate phosphatase-like HAD superfamily hydrolase
MTQHAHGSQHPTAKQTNAETLSKEPLRSWRAGPTRQAIIAFVQQITDETLPTYLPPSERIAAFDNDGTLWCEKPSYVQEGFIIQFFRNSAERDPQLRNRQPYKAFLENDRAYFKTLGIHEVGELVLQAVANLPQEEYVQNIRQFFAEERHPLYHRPFTDTAYIPMLELIRYLQQHNFQNYIVTGGETDFVREVCEELYGIERSHIIGSAVKIDIDMHNGHPIIIRKNTLLEPFNEGAGKAINIHLHIGRQPIIAVGNSDGDIDMLHFTKDQHKPALALLMHHDDDEREFAYEDGATNALQLAIERSWHIISMKNDFERIFSFDMVK